MKPTPEEKQWLKDYLNQVMQYRETYEEVYDHMVLAVGDEPKHEFFETTVANIIARDFGTTNGLYDLEENCVQAAGFNAVTKYRNDLKNWFTSQLVGVTAIIFVLLLYIENLKTKTTDIGIGLLFLCLLCLPGILSSIRGFRSAHKYGASKPSVKDNIIRRITFRSNLFFGVYVVYVS